ncbi:MULTISPECIES: viscotoxin-A3 [unclassified Adlercreutzia]|uniref:viscotoxin-A3 n=1 Tax=unclassified Adlercreutzia TaxID=2636013 RepID=UPI0013EE30FD|nr:MULTISPECIES: viscotoxin-A3 [unclassified Adlercreutzia]
MTLTDEQIKEEEKFLKGLPRFNVGAFFLPPIWGPAHGMWVSILFYPLWLFADNSFYAAYSNPSVLSITLALVVFVSLTVGTVVFAIVGQPFAAHRAERLGVSRETYLRREKMWAVGCVIAGVVMLALATYYNLVIRPTLGA